MIALVATLLANLVNNLPATLLLVPLVAPLGVTAVLAALIGLGVGSSLTYTGSLANLLWRRTLLRQGGEVSAATFHRLSALVTLPAVAVAVVVLWAWAPAGPALAERTGSRDAASAQMRPTCSRLRRRCGRLPP